MEAQLETAVRAFKGQMGIAAIDVRTGETIAVPTPISVFRRPVRLSTAGSVAPGSRPAACRMTPRSLSRSKPAKAPVIGRIVRSFTWLCKADVSRFPSTYYLCAATTPPPICSSGGLGTAHAQIENRLGRVGSRQVVVFA